LMTTHEDDASKGKYPNLQWQSWTNVVYDAYEDTPVYSVYDESDGATKSIPFPTPYPIQIPAEADHSVTIIDWYRGDVWDLWNVRAQAGTYVVGDCYPFSLYGSGVGPGGGVWTCGGSGCPSVAHLIRPEEIEAGVILHPLGCALKTVGPYEGGSRFSTSKGFVRQPATHTDRKVASTNPNEIPEGARIQLDPTINLDSLGLSSTGKIIAKCMQDYGIVCVEAGGSWHIYAEHNYTASWNPPSMSGGVMSAIGDLVTPTYNPWRVIDFELMPTVDDMSEYFLPSETPPPEPPIPPPPEEEPPLPPLPEEPPVQPPPFPEVPPPPEEEPEPEVPPTPPSIGLPTELPEPLSPGSKIFSQALATLSKYEPPQLDLELEKLARYKPKTFKETLKLLGYTETAVATFPYTFPYVLA